VPTAHDETALYMHFAGRLVSADAVLLFNSQEERHLLQRRFNLPVGLGRVVGMGVEPTDPGPPDAAWPDLAERIGASRVLAYLGRVENGKGCRRAGGLLSPLRGEGRLPGPLLLLVGRRTLPIPDHPQILSTGYVSEYLSSNCCAGPTS